MGVSNEFTASIFRVWIVQQKWILRPWRRRQLTRSKRW